MSRYAGPWFSLPPLATFRAEWTIGRGFLDRSPCRARRWSQPGAPRQVYSEAMRDTSPEAEER
ncbi:MAG TPA: hypothetical protein VFQ61_35715, partial [Polyangiaceae bacterium]|nr:hypothetical protein [Polyangiaceae bacterium]